MSTPPGGWQPGDVAQLEDGHLVALGTGDVVNPWVGLTWEDEGPSTPFLTTEDVKDAGAKLVYRKEAAGG